MKKNYRPITSLLLTAVSIGIMWACSNNSTGTNGNNGNNGGGTGTYFANNIQPIFNGSCGGPSCHIPGPQSGVSLGDYNSTINSVGTQYGAKIIKAGDAANSPIVDKISNASPQHGVQMPNGRNPLSQAQIDTIKAWINRGAKENS